jgi:mannose-6-phosphate isomerase-like protein (cupin superfamily)
MSQLVHDPNRRQRYDFHPAGDDLIVEVSAEPGSDIPAHLHPSQEERWTVIEGRVRFKVAGRKVLAGPGDEVAAAPGVKHSFKNVGDGEARVRVEVRPALGLQEFLEEAARLARAGRYTRRGIPRGPRAALELADMLERHRDCTVMAFPPPLVQRRLLFPLARLRRRRAEIR